MNEDLASFWDHLEELRKTLVKIAWVLLLGMGIAFTFSEPILKFLAKPLEPLNPLNNSNLKTFTEKTYRQIHTGKDNLIMQLPEGSIIKHLSPSTKRLDESRILLSPGDSIEWSVFESQAPFLILSPLEGFSMSLKISFWVGFLTTSPIWLYYIFQFITPALYEKEKKLLFPFLGLSLLFGMLGASFAFFATLPIANQYLYSFNSGIGNNQWTLANYTDFSLLIIFGNVVAFELFATLLILVHCGFLKAEIMKGKRKHVIVLAFIVGALLTPPDIPSQVMLAIPLIILYECTIIYAFIREKSYTRTRIKSFLSFSSK